MKTNSTSVEVLIIALLLVPFVYLAFIWNQLPARIATHYDLQGHANDWMLKETSVLVLSILSAVIYLLLRYLPNIDPKGKLQSGNYQKLRVVITLFFAAMMSWLWYVAGHQSETRLSVAAILALAGLMFAGIGNYLTTVKPNWFVGIRTPWTLESDEVWRKTHRLGGRLMVVGGLLSVVLSFAVPMPYTVGAVVGVLILVSLVAVVYSYVYFRQEKTRQRNQFAE